MSVAVRGLCTNCWLLIAGCVEDDDSVSGGFVSAGNTGGPVGRGTSGAATFDAGFSETSGGTLLLAGVSTTSSALNVCPVCLLLTL